MIIITVALAIPPGLHHLPGTQCRCLIYGTIAGWSVSTLAATRRVGRRTWPALREEYFEAGRLRNCACRESRPWP